MSPGTEYGIGAIALATIGIVFWIVKFMFNKLSPMIEDNTKATQKNTQSNHEMFKYLKHKNGQMEECFTSVMESQERIAKKLDHIDERTIQGPKGNTGEQGEQGDRGEKGLTGKKGKAGK